MSVEIEMIARRAFLGLTGICIIAMPLRAQDGGGAAFSHGISHGGGSIIAPGGKRTSPEGGWDRAPFITMRLWKGFPRIASEARIFPYRMRGGVMTMISALINGGPGAGNIPRMMAARVGGGLLNRIGTSLARRSIHTRICMRR